MPKPKMKLTEKQERALNYYYGMSNFNKTDALRRAGYSKPAKYGEFWHVPAVKAEMERREARVRAKYEISHDRLLEELTRVAYASPFDYLEIDDDGYVSVDLRKLSADEAKAIGEIQIETVTEKTEDGETVESIKRIKVKPWNKLDALDKVMRHAGLSKDKQQVTGELTLVDRIMAGRRRVQSADDS